MITGINHITLAIGSMEKSWDFYTQILGFRPVARWSTGGYLLAGDLWVALIVDEHARETTPPEYTHIAFTVDPDNFDTVSHRVRSSGARIWQDNRSEGASLYFVDPDGHKLEIHASDLKSRIETAQSQPWGDIQFFDPSI